jgi:superfamily II DNA/RNA helicase
MPSDHESYHHRVGRAGRFGTKGLAISFVGGGQVEEVLGAVRKMFAVPLPELPDVIEPSTYSRIRFFNISHHSSVNLRLNNKYVTKQISRQFLLSLM